MGRTKVKRERIKRRRQKQKENKGKKFEDFLKLTPEEEVRLITYNRDVTFIGRASGPPWNPYNEWSALAFNYWRCDKCGSILWSTSIKAPKCNCNKGFRKIKNVVKKIYHLTVKVLESIAESILSGGSRSWL